MYVNVRNSCHQLKPAKISIYACLSLQPSISYIVWTWRKRAAVQIRADFDVPIVSDVTFVSWYGRNNFPPTRYNPRNVGFNSWVLSDIFDETKRCNRIESVIFYKSCSFMMFEIPKENWVSLILIQLNSWWILFTKFLIFFFR